MSFPVRVIRSGAVAALLVLGACQKAPAPADEGSAANGTPAPAAAEPAVASPVPPVAGTGWPASLHVFGEGFPNAGDACRNVGESAATADLLDHTAWLVGCQSPDDAAKLGGKVIATVDGITLVSIPR